MLILQDISYIHANKDVVFNNLNLVINRQHKIALVGNNGSGKSTLLKIAAGILMPSHGNIHHDSPPYYVPQHFGQFNTMSIAEALGVDTKLNALKAILNGDVNETQLSLLNDDWSVEERCEAALTQWKLDGLALEQPMSTLSGGQKTKVFLAGITIHQPQIILMDEPSNHLDTSARRLLYEFIQTTSKTLLIVSHDRKLLNLLDTVYELDRGEINTYGGNYAFYAAQKKTETEVVNQDIKSKEKELRKAKQTERETNERQQKLDTRGKKKQEKAGVARIMMNTLRNSAEKSTAHLREVHAEKTGNIMRELNELKKELPGTDKMKLGLLDSALHKGKILVKARDVNHSYEKKMIWQYPLNFTLISGERVAVKGDNGSGKTTLIKLLLGTLESSTGTIQRAYQHAVYIDQDYSLVDNSRTVYGQMQQFNTGGLEEHELKTRLNRFLFTREFWDKPCHVLSGGERMRLTLCCITTLSQTPDLIVLDEPTNNLDIQNIEILTTALKDYEGTLVVISHDEHFLEEIRIETTFELCNIC